MKTYNWKQNILTAIITIAITVIGGMVLYYLQFSQAKLVYTYEKILPFEGQEENLNIYHINISNKGNKISEDVICYVNINPAQIKNYRITSKTPISYNDELKNNNIELKIKSLNPDESAKISILGTSESNFPEQPEIKLRAKGVNGKISENELNDKKEDPKLFTILLTAIAGITSILALFIRKIVGRTIIKEDGKHSDEQNQILAYLCGIHDIPEEVDRFLGLPRKASYWSEMDRLTSLGISSMDKNKALKIKLVLIDLLNYAVIVDTSKGIGYYNLARLEKFLDNDKESKEYLVKATKLIPKLIKKRLTIDLLLKDKTTANTV